MFDDSGPIEPVQLPIDPEHPPVFPGKLPRNVSAPWLEQLHTITEQAGRYLGPDHFAIASLLKAAGDLGMVSFPKLNGYAEYDPDKT